MRINQINQARRFLISLLRESGVTVAPEMSQDKIITEYAALKNIYIPETIKLRRNWMVNFYLSNKPKVDVKKPVEIKQDTKFDKSKYYAYIASPKWRKLKLELLNSRGYNCEKCGTSGTFKSLQVHHLTYERLFNEDELDLIVVCDDCHEYIHSINTTKRTALKSTL